MSWQNISFNLPNLPVNCIKNIPGTDMLLAGTDIGVYLLDSASSNWSLYGIGLPNVIVTDIEFNQVLNKIYVSTFGRGIWETDLGTLLHVSMGNDAKFNADLYPSVNNGTFTIHLSSPLKSSGEMRLEIIDITGRLISKSAISGNSDSFQKLDVKPGKYFARLTSEQGVLVKSFIVE